jgi:rhodanese-related sulfurtransferase
MRVRTLPVLLLLVVLAVVTYRLYLGDFSPFFPFSPFSSSHLALSPAEARRQRFALILDLRAPKDRETLGFYPNSIPVDPSHMLEEVPYLLGDRRPSPVALLVYSAEGDQRAQKAAQALYQKGFTGVRYLNGSYVDMLPPGLNS